MNNQADLSFWNDPLSIGHFRKAAAMPMFWSKGSTYAGNVFADYPLLDRYANSLHAFITAGEELWVVIERDWHGYPDPPQFAILALNAGERQWACDFDHWPSQWRFI
jgi:hypothetical protein